MFLKNKNIIFKIRRSKVTDYAALTLKASITTAADKFCNIFFIFEKIHMKFHENLMKYHALFVNLKKQQNLKL